MKELIGWLTAIEDRAQKIYERAGTLLKSDEEFLRLLSRLAEDEKEHHDYMLKAAEIVEHESYPSIALLNDDIRSKIEEYFLLCEKKSDANELTKEHMVDCIASTEFSEWNNLFLYVINRLKHKHSEFLPMVAGIQNHKRSIERFLESHQEFGGYLERLRSLPRILQEKILVVDDNNMIYDLLEAVLSDEGDMESAINGEEGLKKLHEKYFAVIVSDVDMPVMGGIEFYRKAVETFPNMKERFLFFTGSVNEELNSFFKKNNLKHLMKPALIGEIRKAVVDIITRR